MPPPKKSAIPADKLALYEDLIKSVPQIEHKGAVHLNPEGIHPESFAKGRLFSPYPIRTLSSRTAQPADALRDLLLPSFVVRSAVGAPQVSPACQRWVPGSNDAQRHRCDTSPGRSTGFCSAGVSPALFASY